MQIPIRFPLQARSRAAILLTFLHRYAEQFKLRAPFLFLVQEVDGEESSAPETDDSDIG